MQESLWLQWKGDTFFSDLNSGSISTSSTSLSHSLPHFRDVKQINQLPKIQNVLGISPQSTFLTRKWLFLLTSLWVEWLRICTWRSFHFPDTVSSQLNYYINMDLEALKPRKLGKSKYVHLQAIKKLIKKSKKGWGRRSHHSQKSHSNACTQ